ncbi:MAG: aspartate dehydrogenase [Solirubrobacterales bacterium]|nr:aspartate dehydrogenase [Solirubrobacterales bacterium]MBV9423366.1 aspartate dehydrogenase [Solirubrobacterales bacterium]MBV9798389.1 aspartate dehydrogenase [Solirubrobacterales bacterium]
MTEPPKTRVSVAGLGAVGRELVQRLGAGINGMSLSAVSAADHEKAKRTLDELGVDVPVLTLDELEPVSDIAIECLPAHLLPVLAESMLSAGKELIVLSAGALLKRPDLVSLAEQHGGRIIVPTGALLGLDAVGAAAEGEIYSVKMTTRKPPIGLAGAPHIDSQHLDVEAITEPTLVFSGSARDAAGGFPANLNVAAALALAGAGPERTQVEVWIDPSVTRNTHHIEIQAEAADFSMTIENVPSENPRTGRITALSVIRLLRKRHAGLAVGT